jgi:hypothetical protein
MKTLVDRETGKKFRLGSKGVGALTQRVMDYAAGRRDDGVNELVIRPKEFKAGDKFKCDSCTKVFEFAGGDQDEFLQSIMEHGRGHGVCQIMPII